MKSATQFTEQAGESAQRPLNSHRRISARAVCDMCGSVSDMTLHRWLKDPQKQFPRPIYIAKRRYWREAEIVAWLEVQTVAAE